MSTTSSIWIKVKPEDFGKTISFNKEIHPLELDEFNVAPPTFKIKEKHNPVLYLGVYCHSDGYPSGVGATLLKHFDTYEKVLNLVSLGDLLVCFLVFCLFHLHAPCEIAEMPHQ